MHKVSSQKILCLIMLIIYWKIIMILYLIRTLIYISNTKVKTSNFYLFILNSI